MADNKTGAQRGGHGHGPNGHGFQRPKDMKGTFKKLMGYVGKYKGSLVLVAVCLIVSSVASVASSYTLKPMLNDYILPGDFSGLLKMLVLLGGLFAVRFKEQARNQRIRRIERAAAAAARAPAYGTPSPIWQ